MSRISIHFGAHKTATTYLQGLLDKNAQSLLEHDVVVTTPGRFPDGWMTDFGRFTSKRGASLSEKTNLKRRLQELVPSGKRWVLSHETLCGPANDFKKTNVGLYRLANQRLQGLVDIVEEPVTLFFSVRSYVEFYSSLYSEMIRDLGYFPFDDFMTDERLLSFSWVYTMEQFAKVEGDVNVVLWAYEDFRILENEILNMMTRYSGFNGLSVEEKSSFRRSGISENTIEVLDQEYRETGVNPDCIKVWEVDQKFPSNQDFSKYMPFNEDIIDQLLNKYHDDCRAIKQRFSEFQFLGDF